MNALDDSANTDRWTFYEDSANFLKDERFTKLWETIRPQQTLKDERRGHKNYHMS